MRLKNDEGRLRESCEQSWWTRVWKLNLPSKVKVFILRVFHGILPCFSALARWGVNYQHSCPICLACAETVEHHLWFCPMVLGFLGMLILLPIV